MRKQDFGGLRSIAKSLYLKMVVDSVGCKVPLLLVFLSISHGISEPDSHSHLSRAFFGSLLSFILFLTPSPCVLCSTVSAVFGPPSHICKYPLSSTHSVGLSFAPCGNPGRFSVGLNGKGTTIRGANHEPLSKCYRGGMS